MPAPIAPCGVTMDWLRSAYRTKMRMYRDSDLETEVVWYRAEEGAGVYTGRTPFRSDVHSSRIHPPHPVGEVRGAGRAWSNGFNVGGFVGRAVCGTEEQFANGSRIAIDPTLELGPDGYPLCCTPRLFRGLAGVAVGGPGGTFSRVPAFMGVGGVLAGGMGGLYPSGVYCADPVIFVPRYLTARAANLSGCAAVDGREAHLGYNEPGGISGTWTNIPSYPGDTLVCLFQPDSGPSFRTNAGCPTGSQIGNSEAPSSVDPFILVTTIQWVSGPCCSAGLGHTFEVEVSV